MKKSNEMIVTEIKIVVALEGGGVLMRVVAPGKACKVLATMSVHFIITDQTVHIRSGYFPLHMLYFTIKTRGNGTYTMV